MSSAWGTSFADSWLATWELPAAGLASSGNTQWSTLSSLMNAAWQRSPVTQDVQYNAAKYVRCEINYQPVDDVGVAQLEITAYGLAADFDAGATVGKALIVDGVTYTIIEAQPVENARIALALSAT